MVASCRSVLPASVGSVATSDSSGGSDRANPSGSLGSDGMESSVTSSGPSARARTSAALGAPGPGISAELAVATRVA